MSTRCNVLIFEKKRGEYEFKGQLYHHNDGYIAGVGSALADLCTEWYGIRTEFRQNPTPTELVDFLAKHGTRIEGCRFEKQELQKAIPNADIDYLYTISYDDFSLTIDIEERHGSVYTLRIEKTKETSSFFKRRNLV